MAKGEVEDRDNFHGIVREVSHTFRFDFGRLVIALSKALWPCNERESVDEARSVRRMREEGMVHCQDC